MLIITTFIVLNLNLSASERFYALEDDRGRLLVNASHPEIHSYAGNSWLPMFLTADSTTSLTVDGITRDIDRNLSLSSHSLLEPSHLNVSESTESQVGIGPGSSLVSAYGSVSVIKETGRNHLLLGDEGDHHFNSTCQIGTSILVPLINASVPFLGSIRTTLNDEIQNWVPVTLEFHLFAEGVLFSVPQSFEDELERIMTDYEIEIGFRDSNETESVILNCFEEVLDLFPFVYFDIQGRNATGGTIVFSPEDYLRHDPEHNVCHFRYILSPDPQTPILINPIIFPGTNIRFTRDEMVICDSL